MDVLDQIHLIEQSYYEKHNSTLLIMFKIHVCHVNVQV